MSIELLSTEAKNQIVHDALYAFILSGYDRWNSKNISFYYGLMKNAKFSLPAFLALSQKEGEISACLESASLRFSQFVHWPTVKQNIFSIRDILNRIAFHHNVPIDEQATQQALEHYSSTPTCTLLEERAVLEAQQPWRCTSEPLVQHSENKGWKKSPGRSAINNVGSFLFKCERPKTRATAGFIIAAAGSGLAYTALTPKLVLMLLGAALTPHVTAALLAVGLFLAAVGTAMFIHGLVTNCRHAKPQSHVHRPDYTRDSSRSTVINYTYQSE